VHTAYIFAKWHSSWNIKKRTYSPLLLCERCPSSEGTPPGQGQEKSHAWEAEHPDLQRGSTATPQSSVSE
jgi:hypothetical protein